MSQRACNLLRYRIVSVIRDSAAPVLVVVVQSLARAKSRVSPPAEPRPWGFQA